MNELKIGNRIRQVRESRKLSMQEFADRIGLSRSMVSYYESNKKKPSIKSIEKIASVLDVTTDFLIGKTDSFDGDDVTDKNVKDFLSKFEKLDEDQQVKILKILDTLAD